MEKSRVGQDAHEKAISEHFRLHLPALDEKPAVYSLLCSGGPVTVRSQQMRAMNLAWSLRHQLRRRQTNVAVIGGGAAGVTFAAAAARLGSKVHLFESSTLMHLQVGSSHRPLHPEIYAWPDDTAYRPVSHLPRLGWTTGTANDVAGAILSQFCVLQAEVGSARLRVREGTHAALAKDGTVIARRNDGDPTQTLPNLDIVILAVGFGVEVSPRQLPLNSYWRADALDQSFLGTLKGPAVILVSGAGDGALTDVLRSCVQETQQGPFLDKVLALTLRDEPLRDEIRRIENDRNGRAYADIGAQFARFESLRAVDELLCDKRRSNVLVKWFYRAAHPFDDDSLPINRFIVSRLLHNEKQFDIERHPNARRFTMRSLKDGQYQVRYKCGSNQWKQVLCRQVIVRWGAEKYDASIHNRREDYPNLFRSVANALERPSPSMLRYLDDRFRAKDAAKHTHCRVPWGWESDSPFVKNLESKPVIPRLLAEFVMAFDSPDPRSPDAGNYAYRIRIWLLGLSDQLTVRYDLHPTEGNKPVSRFAMGQYHEQWINTRNDYAIRVRTGDGYEWNVGTVLEAIRARYGLSKMKDKAQGADPRARGPMMLKTRLDDGSFVVADREEWPSPAQAMAVIIRQTPKG